VPDRTHPIAWLALAVLSSCEEQTARMPVVSKPVILVSLGMDVDGLEERLKSATSARPEVKIDSAHGVVPYQAQSLDQNLLGPVEALVIWPLIPDVLHRTLALARQRGIPVVSLMHGEQECAGWVGLGQPELCTELGRKAGDKLKDSGRSRARAAVVEDRRWPRSRERAERVLRGIEKSLGPLDVPVRFPFEFNVATTEKVIADTLTQQDLGLDVIVAGDVHGTLSAVRAVRRLPANLQPLILGVGCDPGLFDGLEQGRVWIAGFSMGDLVDATLEQLATIEEGRALEPRALKVAEWSSKEAASRWLDSRPGGSMQRAPVKCSDE